ncbi:PDDEXK nuclease domain-containing protein [Urbifossiella limnaea]|uniref:PDDEXK nuclease domain-containing protein n=1 Tax=Urbifossiella limnaea TaxID=2528023 RepID=UPI001EE4471A
MGTGFTFVARQKRVRVGDSWYKIDLLLFHRVLRCLVVIDLKLGAFTHADAGQMNLYLNYAREHLVVAGEADPVGLILCSDKDDAVVHYAMGGINARVFASTYRTVLPDEATLRREILAVDRGLKQGHFRGRRRASRSCRAERADGHFAAGLSGRWTR